MEAAVAKVEALSKLVDSYVFKEGSIERKHDDALVLNSGSTYYIQITQKSAKDAAAVRFISRSQHLRKKEPESKGRLGTCDDILEASRIITRDQQAAKTSAKAAMQRPRLSMSRAAPARALG